MESLGAIGGTGRRALTELCQLLGVLEANRESAPAPAGRAPAVRKVADLVAQARQAGQPVELSECGERVPQPAGVELAVYRVLQEALTNALKYTKGRPTTVLVRYDDEHTEIEVTTAGPGAEPRQETPAPDKVVGELTRRDLEVPEQIAVGLSNAEIAEKLFIQPETVKTYVSRILVKPDLRDRVQAVVLAYRVGLVSGAD